MVYKSYKDLDIYKKSHKLAIEIHQMSLELPKFEMYEEGSQIRRSSKSIKSNIVEGFGRRNRNLLNFLFTLYLLVMKLRII
ncbi:MAG: four helix bundle protein [Candidatus Omnitrophota bacterium]